MAAPKPTRGIGNAGSTFKRPERSSAGSLVAALTQVDPALTSQDAPTSTLRSLPLELIAAHPDNPRTQLGDLGELAASITAFGVLQPPVVMTAGAFREHWPHHAEAIGVCEYVVVAGHRRLGAARLAELDSLDVIVRDDLGDRVRTTAAFVVENVHRAGLEPLEEARAYAMLTDLNLSQRQIAQQVGVSQSHVSKRMALLRLPQGAQDALTEGELPVTEAVALAGLPAAKQARIWAVAAEQGLPVASAETVVQREDESRARQDEAMDLADEQGIEVIDPQALFGASRAAHRLTSKDQIAAARAEGTLVGAVDGASGLSYYSRTTRDEATALPSADRERAAAAKARRDACRDLVQRAPERAELVSAVTSTILDGNLGHAAAAKAAHSWLASKLMPGHSDPYRWLEAVRAGDEKTRLHVAWAMTVARAEELAASTHGSWGPGQLAHLQRLIDRTGYVPTAWEQAHLTK